MNSDLGSTAPIPRRGYLYVVLAALMWAVSGSSAKYLFAQGVTPFELVQLRLTIGIALLFLWLLVRRPALLRIAHRDILYFALLGHYRYGPGAVHLSSHHQ